MIFYYTNIKCHYRGILSNQAYRLKTLWLFGIIPIWRSKTDIPN